MLDFLSAISSFFSTIGTFLLNIVQGLVSVIALIPQAFVLITYSIGFLPAALLAFALAGLSICIVFFVIGR